MMKSWMIIADDLTGAADCAIAFAKNDIEVSVVFNDNDAQTDVVSIDVGSRAFPAGKAASMHRRTLERHFQPGMKLYKKIDSLIRGQPAAETAETIEFLRERGCGSFAVLAPAFPSLGRTTQNASILVNGQELEKTPVWAREHTYDNADLVQMLKSTGIRAQTIPLETISQGRKAVADSITVAMRDGFDAVVCDAGMNHDLDIIAQATVPMADKLFWIGTGGLANPLAQITRPETATDPVSLPVCSEGILIVVGSLAKASRDGVKHMLSAASVQHVPVPPNAFFTGDKKRLAELADAVVVGLKAGHDVLVEITEVPDPDLSKGGELAKNLAEMLREALAIAGGLVVTGGETAAALLASAGIDGIRLINEVESGVPVGLTIGARTIPIVTKSGSFGTEPTLTKGLDFVRSVKKKGSF